ncbi:MAG: hypothetical protein JST17_08500 [Bacteroidetes bacterium]|nr:hypothetical protein [Bacteroidota bacterium]MBS1930784.1 hypothetical protein [Bacteroidota bacterium]
MIENLNDTVLVSVKPTNIKMISVTTMVPRLKEPTKQEVIVKSKAEEKEAALPFENWLLPPQPEGYIKYLPYDPF